MCMLLLLGRNIYIYMKLILSKILFKSSGLDDASIVESGVLKVSYFYGTFYVVYYFLQMLELA